MPSSSNPELEEAIAIVGFASRLPQGVDTSAQFWDLLKSGRNVASPFPADRVNFDAFYNPDGERVDTFNVQKACFLTQDLRAFDAPFFAVPPAEAEALDPQQRILLETSYHALESAGISMAQAKGSRTAVYIAASTRDFEVMLCRDPERMPKYMGTGVGTTMLANRISWFFDFSGPSLAIDTACSGSLSALHHACRILSTGDSDMALVGGVSLIILPDASVTPLSTLGFLSPDGVSYSFDSRATGHGKGEGVGVVVLKRYTDAIRDRDMIRGVIRATSLNQDGRTPGITQPSEDAQALNIKAAYSYARLDTKSTGYFEAHGTGTAVGDPMEARAIHKAFRRSSDQPLFVGSCKANIGHLEAGAGIAALIKAILVLEKGVIPPNASFKEPNPEISEHDLGIKFARGPSRFPYSDDGVRRVSINSFGYGGSNAHVILDDALSYTSQNSPGASVNHQTLALVPHDAQHRSTDHTFDEAGPLEKISVNGGCVPGVDQQNYGDNFSNGGANGSTCDDISLPHILYLSASDEAGVGRIVSEYSDYLSQPPSSSSSDASSDLIYTLNSRRTDLRWKTYYVGNSIEELVSELKETKPEKFASSGEPSVSFVFTGQGAQWGGMAKGLNKLKPFADSIRASQSYLDELLGGWSIFDELAKASADSRINEPYLSQPLCTILQIGLVDLLRAFDVNPVAVVGHSSGEIAAAYCAGLLTHRDAVQISYLRGSSVMELQSELSKAGGMLSVSLSESEVQPFIAEVLHATGSVVEVGCVNSDSNVTVSGDALGLDHLIRLLEAQQHSVRKLKVSVAYHSRHMVQVASEYERALQKFLYHEGDEKASGKAARPALFSSVTGKAHTGGAIPLSYWTENLVARVQYASALRSMISFLVQRRNTDSYCLNGQDIILEIGPHAALRRATQDGIEAEGAQKSVSYEMTGSRGVNPLESLARTAGRLRCQGVPLPLHLIGPPPKRGTYRILADLPKYPFNHSRTYWAESRLSKQYRFRQFGRHELLGVRDRDWNPLRPRWRYLFDSRDQSWLHHHQIGETKLLPAASMLVMAIEGMRQLSGRDETIKSYRLEDVLFSNALTTSSEVDTSPIEAHLSFNRVDDDASGYPVTCEFSIDGLVRDNWIDVCKGTITIHHEGKDNHVGSSMRSGNVLPELQTSDAAWEDVAVTSFYERLRHMDYSFGSAFQRLTSLQYSSSAHAKARVSMDGWTRLPDVEQTQISPHVIHPTDLDAHLQTCILAHSRGGTDQGPTLLPRAIGSLWVAHSLLDRDPEKVLNLTTTRTYKGLKDVSFSIESVDAEGQPCVSFESFKTVIMGSDVPNSKVLPGAKRLMYSLKWKPDLDLLDYQQILAICRQAADISDYHSLDYIARAEALTMFCMQSVVANYSDLDSGRLPHHLKKYVNWNRRRFDERELRTLLVQNPQISKMFGTSEQREEFLHSLAEENAEGRLGVETYRNLDNILAGNVDPLSVIFDNGVAGEYYASPTFNLPIRQMMPYVDLLAFKHPSMNILEIGAGTGAATARILDTLSNYSGFGSGADRDIPRFQRYTYTDISPAFFLEAENKFSSYHSLSFATLDIEKDPVAQGFQKYSYDLILCSAVLHATKSLTATLQNVHTLLKPGGSLLLVEPTAIESPRINFTFGLLPGWWLSSEKEREWTPCLSEAQWHDILLENGFDGASIVVHDNNIPSCRLMSGIITKSAVKREYNGQSTYPVVAVVSSADSSMQSEVSSLLAKDLVDDGRQTAMIKEQDIETYDFSGKLAIILVEFEASVLIDVNHQQWTAYSKLLRTALGVIWVAKGNANHPSEPDTALTTGLLRVLQSEQPDRLLVVLSIDDFDTGTRIASPILKVLNQVEKPTRGSGDLEFAQIDGILHNPRLESQPMLNRHIENLVLGGHATNGPFGAENRHLELTMATPGLFDTFQFQDDRNLGRPLISNEIEVQVMAIGLNFKDIMVAAGQVPGDALGFECAGVVTKVAPASKFKVGDRVCGCTTTGAFKTFATLNSSATMHIPARMSFADASSIPLVFATAYHALVNVANLQPGESVLIHSGAGGVGQAAIQLALRLGAEIFTTVSTPQKRSLVNELYGIPLDHIFGSRHTSFADEVRAKRPGGLDVILNSLSGDKQTASWKCIAPMGRFVEIGKVDISSRPLLMAPFARNVTFSTIALDVVMEKAATSMSRTMTAISDLFALAENPLTVPSPVNRYGLHEIEKAYRLMQSGKHSGKIVIEMNPASIVPILPPRRSAYNFDGNASYVISGGLGGLGRQIILWMVSRGAKCFLILSRSGLSQKAAIAFVKALHSDGIHVEAPCCDITDGAKLLEVVTKHQLDFAPIKGCIQASMVLKDRLFDNMDAQIWNSVIRPKRLGTINLGECLPKSMDFFVLLSSVASVVGPRGSANYTAANNFQDAYAKERASQGLPCISLNLGVVLDVGYAAQHDLVENLRESGLDGITKAEVLAMLDFCCDPLCESARDHNRAHIVAGLASAETQPVGRLKALWWTAKPLFRNFIALADLVDGAQGDTRTDSETVSSSTLLENATSKSAAIDIIVEALINRFAKLMAVPVGDIDARRPLSSFGIDSLVSLELRYWMQREFKADVPVLDIIMADGVEHLASIILERSSLAAAKE